MARLCLAKQSFPHGRYDDIKSGRMKPIDGEAFFENLRQREDELLAQRRPE